MKLYGKRILKLISHLFRSPSYDRFERVSNYNYIFHDNRTNGITCSYAFPYRISQIKITARYRRWSRWHFANEGGAGSLYTYVEVAQTRRVVHEEQNARTEREPGRIKGENFCRMDARWIYLICSNVRKPRNTLNSALNYRLLYIYIYRSVSRVKCNRHFVKYQIHTVSNLSIVFPSARFLRDISNKHLEN